MCLNWLMHIGMMGCSRLRSEWHSWGYNLNDWMFQPSPGNKINKRVPVGLVQVCIPDHVLINRGNFGFHVVGFESFSLQQEHKLKRRNDQISSSNSLKFTPKCISFQGELLYMNWNWHTGSLSSGRISSWSQVPTDELNINGSLCFRYISFQ
jgi:hypothetical protein